MKYWVIVADEDDSAEGRGIAYGPYNSIHEAINADYHVYYGATIHITMEME